MIQAIVFLPLIGAVLAGLIAIFGAHARNPSGDTVEHHDDAHGHDAHAVGRARTIMRPTTMATTIIMPSSRAAAGTLAAELITTGLLLVGGACRGLPSSMSASCITITGSRCSPGLRPATCKWHGRCGSTPSPP